MYSTKFMVEVNRIVDPNRTMSVHEVLKLVEERFTSKVEVVIYKVTYVLNGRSKVIPKRVVTDYIESDCKITVEDMEKFLKAEGVQKAVVLDIEVVTNICNRYFWYKVKSSNASNNGGS